MGYCSWGRKELDTTEQLTHTHTHTHTCQNGHRWNHLKGVGLDREDPKLIVF